MPYGNERARTVSRAHDRHGMSEGSAWDRLRGTPHPPTDAAVPLPEGRPARRHVPQGAQLRRRGVSPGSRRDCDPSTVD